ASGTQGHPGARLVMQSDGNVVIYDPSGVALWATGTDAPAAPPPPPPPSPPGPSSPPPPADALASGQSLSPGMTLSSADGRFHLAYQGDGNLVLDQDGVGPIWASGTGGLSAGATAMQGDGNVVIYDASGNPVWSSGTQGHAGAHLLVQADGNV